MNEASVDFGKGHQDELPLVKTGVRNLKPFGSDLYFIKKEDVQINGPRPPSESLLSSQLGLDGLQCPEKLRRLQIRFDPLYTPH